MDEYPIHSSIHTYIVVVLWWQGVVTRSDRMLELRQPRTGGGDHCGGLADAISDHVLTCILYALCLNLY